MTLAALLRRTLAIQALAGMPLHDLRILPRRRLRWRRAAGAMAASLPLLATTLPALGADAAAPPASTPPKVLRYALEIAETGFDPIQLSDAYSRMITANIFETPVQFEWLAPAGTLTTMTAASMPEVSDDFRTFTITLKPGILFADDPAFNGQPRELVAADYVYSIKRAADPRWKSPVWSSWEESKVAGLKALHEEAVRTGRFDYDRPIAGLQVLDRYRYRIVLEEPAPRFLQLLASPSINGAVAREVVERYGNDIMAHPVGTGPFRLVEWRRSSRIVLERNPHYREVAFDAHPDPADADAVALAQRLKGRRLPMIDRVELTPIEESQPRWLAFLNAEHDLLYRMPRDLVPIALPNNVPSPALQRRNVDVRRTPEIDVSILVYNMEDPMVGGEAPAQVALRRALNLGLNLDAFIASVLKYQAIPAQTLIAPGLTGYDPKMHSEFGDYDPVRANALLDVYGFRRGPDGWRTKPDGSPLAIEISTEPDQRSRLSDEIYKKSFDALGVRLRLRVAKFPENLRKVQNGQFQAWRVTLGATGPDPQDALRLGYSGSIGGYDLSRWVKPEFDRLYLRSGTLPDGPERLALLRQMNELLLAYAPLRAVAHRLRVDMAYPWVIGFRNWPFIPGGWWSYVDIDNEARQAAGR